ncbi:MAG: hypothetical protein ABSA52_12290 [Candidatus Binatia bacterium]
MITTLLILSLLLALAAAMTTSIISDINLRAAYDRATAGFYAAESGLDAGMGGYRDLFLAFKVPTSANFQPQTVTVGSRTVTYNLVDRNPTPGIPTTVQVPYGQVFGGLNSQQYTYVVNSSAVNTLGDTEASVGAEFQVGYIPLFQFVAFYNNDLEIDPGATMTLNGRVHTNGNLYLGPDANLTISTNAAIGVNYVQVTAGGNIERGRKDTGACNTSPTLQVSTASNSLQTLGCIGTSTAVVPPATLATWGGTMQSGVTHISVPQPAITARGGGAGTYWGEADLRIGLILHYPGGWHGYPHMIAVLNSDSTVNTTLQPTLENFLFQTPAASSSTSGNLRPLFYTDAPTVGTTNPSACLNCTNSTPWNCTTATTGAATGRPACYSPAFQNQYSSSSCTTASVTAASRVYGQMNSAGRAANPYCAGDADPRHGGFYNWREGRWTYLLNLNVHDLLQWNIDQGGPFFSPSVTTDGGVILYLTVFDYNYPTTNSSPNLSPDGTASSFGFGVRIFGSNTLPFPSLASFGGDPTGISIASDRAMYVQGDYNAPPGAGGVYNPTTGWQPSSIVGDAMNIMSNAYFATGNTIIGNYTGCLNDCQSNRDLSDATRNASTTTINTGFLAGVDTTTSGNYNGGLENYPRFHEDWGGPSATLNYLGSFVSLGTPQTVTGPWCGTEGSYTCVGTSCVPTLSGCNIYNPPTRAWNFDPNFQNAAYVPPLTPRFVYVQQIRFTENFQ